MPPVAEPTTDLVVAEDLVKVYAARRSSRGRRSQEIRALDGVSLSLRRGETLGIVGESGSGKSTLARLLVNLERPTAGRLQVAGEELASLSGASRTRAWRSNVQMVFQDPYSSLNPSMTVAEIVKEPWRVHRDVVPRSDWDAELEVLLDAVGLASRLAARKPGELSGGQRQRVTIARALALKPKLLVCDEAVASLDVSIQAQILTVLEQVRESHDVSYVFISHDLAVVRYFCDRVAVMYLGRIVEAGSGDEVYERPKHPYTTALLSAEPAPRFDGRPSRRITLEGEIPDPTAIPSGCRFRTRCWKAQDVCATTPPDLEHVDGTHRVACHFPEPTTTAQENGHV